MKRISPRIIGGAMLVLLLLSIPAVLLGNPGLVSEVRRYVSDIPAAPPEEHRWVFTADRVVGEMTSATVEAFGNCTLSYGSDVLRADYAKYYRETGWVLLRGNITAHWQGDFLQAEEAEFDLNNRLGWLKKGQVFVGKPHIYVKADYIERKGGDSYTFSNAKVTACSGESPAWSVGAQRGDIDIDGQIKLYHSSFRIKDVPVAYMPYASLPGGRKRRSGLLLPEVGSSSRLGFSMNLPYYWVINDEVDMTFTEYWMSRRGLMQGVELRHVNDAHSKGLWKFDWLNDKKRANTLDKEDDAFKDDGLLRPNRNRWWARAKYDGWVGTPSWKVMVDLDMVSDQNYLREFRYGRSGFEASRKEFLREFGRDIDDIDAQNRTSTIFMARSWDRFGTAGKVAYTQNLAFMNGNGDETKNPTLQVLPELDLFAWKDSIPGTPLEGQASLKYDYFWRAYGDKGHRVDFRPEMSLPITTRWLSVIPRVGLYQTFYSTKAEKTGETRYPTRFNPEKDTTQSGESFRNIFESGLTMFSEVSKVYYVGEPLAVTRENADKSEWSRIKHSIIPRAEYTYRPNTTNQSRLPYYDTRDRIYGKNLFTYSLTNVLDRRRDRVTLEPGADGDPVPTLATDYLSFLTFRLEQSYDVNEADRKDKVNQYPTRPYSDVLAELVVKPEEYVDIVSRAWFSPHMEKITQHEHLVRLYKEGLGDIYGGFDFLEPVDEYNRLVTERLSILRAGGSLRFARNMTLGLDYRRDLEKSRDLERTISLTLEQECYDIRFLYSQTPDDDRFGISFDILKF